MPTEYSTIQQETIREFYRLYTGKHGYAPTVREVGDHLGVKESTAHAAIKKTAGLKQVKIGRSTFRWVLDDSYGE